MKIDPEHYKYLVIQRGELDAYKGNIELWRAKYLDGLQQTMKDLLPVLPKIPGQKVLDIGSGMGGIHILLRSVMKGTRLSLLDGIYDQPEVKRHDKTFNNEYHTRDFLEQNGVDVEAYYSPNNPPNSENRFDCIFSFASWCFHYPPSAYTLLVKDIANGLLVVDLRKDRPTWREGMERLFGQPTVLNSYRKFVRCAFFIK